MKDTCGLCSILESGEVSTTTANKSRYLEPATGGVFGGVDSMVESIVASTSKLDSIAEIKEDDADDITLHEEEKKTDDQPKKNAAIEGLRIDTLSTQEPPKVFDSPKAAAAYRAAKAAAAAAAGSVTTVSTNPVAEITLAPTLERDFDKNPTELYLTLMRKDWSAAIRKCAERPEEAQTWIYRKESNGALRWKLLPIHASIIFNAPLPVIDSLLHAYQAGAACKDDQGMVPLHLAIRMNSDPTVVEKLVAAQPQAVTVTDRKGRTPKALAEKQAACPKTLLVIQTLDNAASTKSKPAPVVTKAVAPPLPPTKPVAYASPKAATEAKKVAAAAAAALAATTPTTPRAIDTTNQAAPLTPSGVLAKNLTDVEPSAHTVSHQELEELKTVVERLETEAVTYQTTISNLEESAQTIDAREAVLNNMIAELEATVEKTAQEKTFSEDSNKAVITNLVSQIGDLQGKLTATNKAKEEAITAQTNYEEASKQEMAKMKLKGLEVERQLCQVTFLRDEKTEALFKAEKFIVQQKGQIALLQEDNTALREKLTTTETKLEEVTLSEQELAWRNNALTTQLNNSSEGAASSKSAPIVTPEEPGSNERIQALEREREDLRDTVNKLSVKLYKVVGFLDEMVQEQEAIITETMTRDSEIMMRASNSMDLPQSPQQQSDDRHKLLSNVAGMKEQIIGVIDSVIEGMPNEEDEDLDNMKPPASILQ